MSFYREMQFLERSQGFINKRDFRNPYICVKVSYSEYDEIKLEISTTTTNIYPNGWSCVCEANISRKSGTQLQLLKELADFCPEYLQALPLACRMVAKADAVVTTLLQQRDIAFLEAKTNMEFIVK